MSIGKELELSRTCILKRESELKKRERLLPCIEMYDSKIIELRKKGTAKPEVDAMSYITSILRCTYSDVLKQISAAGKSGISAINAIKRSAGTNYQGLCEYALIQWLKSEQIPFHIGPNAPKKMKDELTIYGDDSDGGSFSVEPDIDISLWLENDDTTSPIIFISAKTSLVDRAGQAARWKMYLDLHQTTCPHVKNISDCPINRTKVKIKTEHPITHAIVTANIYKIDSTLPHGELSTGQCRNNTYMFKHKYSTRNDDVEIRPSSWSSFAEITNMIEETYYAYRMR